MKKLLIVGAAIAALSVAAYLAIPETPAPSTAGSALPPEGAPLVSIVVPDQLSAQAQLGKTAFDAVCATCHGSNATGKMGFGPPLIHPIYEPNHHGDMAIWRFRWRLKMGSKRTIGLSETCLRKQA